MIILVVRHEVWRFSGGLCWVLFTVLGSTALTAYKESSQQITSLPTELAELWNQSASLCSDLTDELFISQFTISSGNERVTLLWHVYILSTYIRGCCWEERNENPYNVIISNTSLSMTLPMQSPGARCPAMASSILNFAGQPDKLKNDSKNINGQ